MTVAPAGGCYALGMGQGGSLLLAALVGCGGAGPPDRPSPAWTVDILEDRLGSDTALAVVRDGGLLCASTSRALKVFRRGAEGPWALDHVVEGTASLAEVALAVTPTDAAHVIYHPYTAGEAELRHVRRPSAGEWTTYETIGGAAAGEGASLAVGPEARLWTAFYDFVDDELQVAEALADGGWRVESLPGEHGRATSIAMAGDGEPRVAYYDWRARTLRYATRDPSGRWHVEEVAQGEARMGKQALAVDPAQGAHVCYVTAEALRCAHRRAGRGWDVEVVDAGPVWWQSPALAIDATGGLHLGYGKEGIWYAHREAVGPWSAALVERGTAADTALGISIVTDDAGAVHLAYDWQGDTTLMREVHVAGMR